MVQTGTGARIYYAASCSIARGSATGNASTSEMACPTSEGTYASPDLQWIGECIGTVNCQAVDT